MIVAPLGQLGRQVLGQTRARRCDDISNVDRLTREPKTFFTDDPETNRRSLKRLGELEPKLVLVGHGPPYRDTKKFVEFCESV